MSVIKCDIDSFMSHPLRNRYRRKSKFNAVRHMRMSKSMNSNSLHPCRFCSSVHLVVQIAFGKWEQPCMLIAFVKHSEIIFHLPSKKLWQLNYTIALFRFGTGNIILTLQMLVRFVDCQFPVRNIKIASFQS